MMFLFWGISLILFMIMAVKFGLFLLTPVFWVVGFVWNLIVSCAGAIFHACFSLFTKNKLIGIIIAVIIAAAAYRCFA